MFQWFFTAVAKWSLARLKRYGKLPTGLPGHRDPENKCPGYQPREIQDSWAWYRDCETDGHYLCVKCIHRRISETEDEQ